MIKLWLDFEIKRIEQKRLQARRRRARRRAERAAVDPAFAERSARLVGAKDKVATLTAEEYLEHRRAMWRKYNKEKRG